jgi:hypothetical protein
MGAWSTAHEIVDCTDLQEARMIIPSYTVRPRGWYDGIWTVLPYPRYPRFSHLEIAVFLDDCPAGRVHVQRADLKKYENKWAVFEVACGKLTDVSFQQPPPH